MSVSEAHAEETSYVSVHEEQERNTISKKRRYVIVRSVGAGCHAGELVSRRQSSVVLHNARRLWYWVGAATLSELAQRGTSKPHECRFPAPVTRIEILSVVEIIDVTEQAGNSIESVTPWTA